MDCSHFYCGCLLLKRLSFLHLIVYETSPKTNWLCISSLFLYSFFLTHWFVCLAKGQYHTVLVTLNLKLFLSCFGFSRSFVFPFKYHKQLVNCVKNAGFHCDYDCIISIDQFKNCCFSNIYFSDVWTGYVSSFIYLLFNFSKEWFIIFSIKIFCQI